MNYSTEDEERLQKKLSFLEQRVTYLENFIKSMQAGTEHKPYRVRIEE
jgi:hypothetical protein